MPVSEIEQRVSSAEFSEWIAFWKMEHDAQEKARRESGKPARGKARGRR